MTYPCYNFLTRKNRKNFRYCQQQSRTMFRGGTFYMLPHGYPDMAVSGGNGADSVPKCSIFVLPVA